MNSNDCMQPSVSSNVPCNTDTTTNEVVQRNKCLTVRNPNTENGANNFNFNENIGEFELNALQFSTNSTENTQKSTLKRFVVKYYFLE